MNLWIVFVVGLAGSIHCVGMCGGFVAALTQLDRSSHPLLRHGAYYLGKTATYTIFGAAAGAAGTAVGALLGRYQDGLSIALGVLLIGLGLWILGLIHMRKDWGVPGLSRLSTMLGHLLHKGSVPASFGLGMLNGALPCALVYAMLVTAAATGSVLGGALTMAVFGLATIPALVAVSISTRLARPIWREHANRVAGMLVILMGIVTVVRGIPAVRGVIPHGDHGQIESVEDDASSSHTHHH